MLFLVEALAGGCLDRSRLMEWTALSHALERVLATDAEMTISDENWPDARTDRAADGQFAPDD